jgi:hypothetical protein
MGKSHGTVLWFSHEGRAPDSGERTRGGTLAEHEFVGGAANHVRPSGRPVRQRSNHTSVARVLLYRGARAAYSEDDGSIQITSATGDSALALALSWLLAAAIRRVPAVGGAGLDTLNAASASNS